MLMWIKDTKIKRTSGRPRPFALFECSYCHAQKEMRKETVSRSCGCQQGNIDHGLSKHPLYKVWAAIKQRCLNPNHPKYHRYGGRGIILYSNWIQDAEAFIEYVTALQNASRRSFSIDRINTEGNYEPGNLRWATSAEQMNNLSLTPRRNSKCLTTRQFDLSFIPSQESKDPSALS